MIPAIKVTSIKLKPLLSARALKRLSPEKVLQSLEREVLKKIKSKILQEAFSARAKRALTQGVKIKLGPKSITVMATHPAFIPLLMGQRSGQMSWLRKATRPIPIVTDTGELIFRSATAKSMKDGKWIHPGRDATTVIERARKEARVLIRERVAKELRKQIGGMLRR